MYQLHLKSIFLFIFMAICNSLYAQNNPLKYYYHYLYPDQGKQNTKNYKRITHNEKKLNQIIKYWTTIKKTDLGNSLLWKKRKYKFTYASENASIIVVGDVHGDLNSFLAPLILGGIAKINKKNPYVLINPRTGRRSRKLLKQHIKIPNLTLRTNPQNRAIFLGDYVDRGVHSVEILYLIFDLLNQQSKNQTQNAIKAIIGNHELLLMQNDYKYFLKNKKITLIRKKLVNLNYPGQLLSKYLGNLQLPLIEVVDGILFSHSHLTKCFLSSLKKEVKSKDRSTIQFFLDMENSNDFFLTENYLTNLNSLKDLINQHAISKFVLYGTGTNSTKSAIFASSEISGGPLWVRSRNNKTSYPIKTLQVGTGHLGLKEYKGSQINNRPTFCFDIRTSSNYHSDTSHPSFFFIKKGKISQIYLERSQVDLIPKAFKLNKS